MQSAQTSKSTALNLAIASLSVGWLIGLSVSPVINIIVSSVIVILISAVTFLSGLNTSDEQKVKIPGSGSIQTFPIAILMLFIAVGASIGIYARTNGWLGKKNESMEIMKADPGHDETRADLVAGLYAISAEDCDMLYLKSGNDLRKAFLNIQNKDINNILEECTSDSCLIYLKNILCNSKK